MTDWGLLDGLHYDLDESLVVAEVAFGFAPGGVKAYQITLTDHDGCGGPPWVGCARPTHEWQAATAVHPTLEAACAEAEALLDAEWDPHND